jgi:hypothetical protein
MKKYNPTNSTPFKSKLQNIIPNSCSTLGVRVLLVEESVLPGENP